MCRTYSTHVTQLVLIWYTLVHSLQLTFSRRLLVLFVFKLYIHFRVVVSFLSEVSLILVHTLYTRPLPWAAAALGPGPGPGARGPGLGAQGSGQGLVQYVC